MNSPEDLMELPLDLDGLTPDWVTQALSHRYPDTAVQAVSIDGVIAGTASKARLRLAYRDGGNPHGLADTLYAKGGFHGPQQLELGGVGYVREALFFRHLAPKLEDLEIPGAFFSATNAVSGQSIVLMEDLTTRDVTFGKATSPVSSDTAAVTLEWLASLHGRFWNVPVSDELQPWPGVIKEVTTTLLSEEFWGAMTGRPLAAPVPDAMRNPERTRQALEAMWAAFDNIGPQTLIHGDAHLGNMYFLPDGQPGFLDWQSPMRGPWADDVTYFLVGSLSVEERRKYERELLQHYLACLGAQRGVVAPGFDDAWLAYRQQVMHGFMWVATPPQMQPDDIVAANTERFCAALEDLETLRALGL